MSLIGVDNVCITDISTCFTTHEPSYAFMFYDNGNCVTLTLVLFRFQKF